MVLGELGEAEALARDPAAAGHLREALELVVAPAIRVRLARILSEMLIWDARPLEAHAVLVRIIDELGPTAAPPLRATLETLRALTASVDRRLIAEIQPRLHALRELATTAGPAGRGLLVFDACWQAGCEPYFGNWRELLEAGLDHGRLVTEESAGPQLARYVIAALVFADEVRRARDLIAEVRADTVSRGSIDAHLSGLTWGALLALRGGELARAEDDARAALELADRHGVVWARIWSATFLAHALLERDAIAEADASLSRAPIDAAIDTIAAPHALLARGRLRLAQGRAVDAIADLRAAGEAAIPDNPNFVPWRSALALALAPDEPVEARSLADAELERARLVLAASGGRRGAARVRAARRRRPQDRAARRGGRMSAALAGSARARPRALSTSAPRGGALAGGVPPANRYARRSASRSSAGPTR